MEIKQHQSTGISAKMFVEQLFAWNKQTRPSQNYIYVLLQFNLSRHVIACDHPFLQPFYASLYHNQLSIIAIIVVPESDNSNKVTIMARMPNARRSEAKPTNPLASVTLSHFIFLFIRRPIRNAVILRPTRKLILNLVLVSSNWFSSRIHTHIETPLCMCTFSWEDTHPFRPVDFDGNHHWYSFKSTNSVMRGRKK